MIEWTTPGRRPLRRQPAAMLALAWLLGVASVALAAPLLAPARTAEAGSARSLLPPGPGAPLGTDLLGRDILSRLLWGSRSTLQMGALALIVAVGLGLPMGLIASAGGARLDLIAMRLVDALLAFPGLLLAMTVVTVMGPGTVSVAVATGLAAAPPYARVARAVAREVLAQPYIEAARAVGATRRRIIWRHVLPNAAPGLIAFAATQLGWVLLNGAALNFLGLGVPPGTPEWGAMLAEGRAFLRDAPWVSSFPGLALTLTVLSANMLGDALQETLSQQ